jgi:hypothetical protein
LFFIDKNELNLSQGHTTSSEFFIERIGQVSSTSVPHVTCIVVEPFALII